jgi:hypothetical protein
MKRFFLSGLTFVALSAACDSPNTYLNSSSGAVTSVTLGMTGSFTQDGRIVPGGTFQVVATAHYENGPGENVTNTALWQSTDQSVASVTQQGVLTALAPGTTIVTATFLGTIGSLPVTVSAAP